MEGNDNEPEWQGGGSASSGAPRASDGQASHKCGELCTREVTPCRQSAQPFARSSSPSRTASSTKIHALQPSEAFIERCSDHPCYTSQLSPTTLVPRLSQPIVLTSLLSIAWASTATLIKSCAWTCKAYLPRLASCACRACCYRTFLWSEKTSTLLYAGEAWF